MRLRVIDHSGPARSQRKSSNLFSDIQFTYTGLGPLFLSLYLGLALVYRIPGLDPEYLRLGKGILFAAGLATVLLPPLWQGRLSLPAGLLGVPGFCGLVILSIPGLVQARELSLIVSFILDVGLCAAFLWCFHWLARQGQDCGPILFRSFMMVSCLAAFHGIGILSGTGDWNAACEWGSAGNTILGGRLAGWSIGLSMFLPVATLLPSVAPRLTPVLSALAMISGSAILAVSQFISGGRSGILASLISLVVLAFPRTSRWSALSVLAGMVVVGAVLFDDSCVQHLSLERLSATIPDQAPSIDGGPLYRKLNFVSANRLSGYQTGLVKLAERPLRGHGLGQVLVQGSQRPNIEIHNLWLKWAVYSGILGPLLFAAMAGSVLVAGIRLWIMSRQDAVQGSAAMALILIVISGLLASMLQPNALIGSFQYTALWWAAAGLLIGRYDRQTQRGGWLVPLGRAH